MIWQNAWAFAGMFAAGLPVLIHLLGRNRSRVERFPTLRFLGISRLAPTRRTRVTDVPVLLVRIAIVAAAAAALAQPLWLTATRRRDAARAVVRAIVVDTSLSMRRTTATGVVLADSAERAAAVFAGSAGTSVIVRSAQPSRALAGVVGWLNAQQGAREIVVLSDFQSGTFGDADFAAVPHGIGVRLEHLVPALGGAIEARAMYGGIEHVAHVALVADRTDVEWTFARLAPAPRDSGLLVLAGASEHVNAEAARTAALAVGPAFRANADRPVALVYSKYEQRAALLREARRIEEPWMAEVVARLRRDQLLANALQPDVIADIRPAESAAFVAVVQRSEHPLAFAAQDEANGRKRLLIFSDVDAGSVASAELVEALARAVNPASTASELDPSSIDARALSRWQRPAADRGSIASDGSGASDGRWLWAFALALLLLETWMRRTTSSARAREAS